MRKFNKTMVVFFGFFAAFSLFILAISIGSMIEAEKTKSWSTTTGVITNSYVETSYGSKNSVIYTPYVVYEYQVGGLTYTGYRVHLSTGGSGDYGAAQSIVNNYFIGRDVTVYYDPNSPSSSVLETGSDSGILMFLGVGGAFLAIGIAGIVWGLRSKTEYKAERIGWGRTRYTAVAPRPNEGVHWQPCGGSDLRWEEKMLWNGKPDRKAFLMNYRGQSILVTIFFIAFSLFFVIAGLLANVLPIVLIGGAFIAIGVAGMAWTMNSQSKKYPGIVYVLTDRRIMAKGIGKVFECGSIDLENINEIIVTRTFLDRRMKTGTLYIGDSPQEILESMNDPDGIRKKILEAANEARLRRIRSWGP